MSASEELERGQLAADVLKNRVYRESMDQLQSEILTKWQGEHNQADRDWLWAMMQACKRLDKVLETTMQTGQLRSKQIDMERSRLEKVGRAFRVA
jgi:hypothetical protein